MVCLRRAFRLGALVIAAAALTVALAAPVSSAPPVRFSETIDDAFDRPDLTETCGFPVSQTLQGTVQGWDRFDAGGNFVGANVHINLDGAFIANGTSLPFVIRQHDRVTVNADGSATVTTTGIQGRLTVPGRGAVGATIGRLVLVFPPGGGDPEVVFEAGRDNAEAFFGSPGSPGTLCTLLA